MEQTSKRPIFCRLPSVAKAMEDILRPLRCTPLIFASKKNLRTKFILVFAILQIEAILRKVHLHQFFYKSCPAHGGRRISFVYIRSFLIRKSAELQLKGYRLI